MIALAFVLAVVGVLVGAAAFSLRVLQWRRDLELKHGLEEERQEQAALLEERMR